MDDSAFLFLAVCAGLAGITVTVAWLRWWWTGRG